MMRDDPYYFNWQMRRYGWAMCGVASDFTTVLCETPRAFMLRRYEDVR